MLISRSRGTSPGGLDLHDHLGTVTIHHAVGHGAHHLVHHARAHVLVSLILTHALYILRVWSVRESSSKAGAHGPGDW